MKSTFDKSTRDELVSRISRLNESSKAQWGKMNLYQMLKHCTLAEEMFLGKTKYKRAFIGRLFGRVALRNLLKNENQLQKNAPTSSAFIIKETGGNVALQKEKWMSLVEEYGTFLTNDFVHWFFGKMTKDQVGYFAYKHIDHHLRQFNQ